MTDRITHEDIPVNRTEQLSLPGDATSPLQTGNMRAPPAVLHGNGAGYQLCAGPGAGPESKAHLFREKGITRRRDEIPGAGEGNVSSGVFSQEAPSLLPQLYGGSDDKPLYTEGAAEALRGWKNGALGGGAVRIRHPV